ncbi:hypothetical protein WISP_127012 [Willisornis vidua]|uniref:Uncharacterized protein n=1 Tax=Willisornis vidua TaxID=1566151 RepID=A0ABQ9CRQ6_9PASS|nr:hypothetical protein WISP_127012 [Willisornis vidua]
MGLARLCQHRLLMEALMLFQCQVEYGFVPSEKITAHQVVSLWGDCTSKRCKGPPTGKETVRLDMSLGAILGKLGARLGKLGAILGEPVPGWASWCQTGRAGARLGKLGAILGELVPDWASWCQAGQAGAILGELVPGWASWVPDWASWVPGWASWCHPGRAGCHPE